MKEFNDNSVENILLNMHAGLLPNQLSSDEVSLLKNKFGDNWFNKLGYTEPKFERSKYDHYNNNFHKKF